MEENSELINKLKSISEDCLEESEQDIKAAETLCDMKRQKIDNNTTKEFWILDCKYFGKNLYAQNNQQPQEEINSVVEELLVAPEKFIANLNETAVFPVEKLNGHNGNFSKPLSKQLTNTDVADNQARLCLKSQHVISNIKPTLKTWEELERGIQVRVYDWEGKEYSMVFKILGSKSHVLTSGWKKFFNDHDLKAHVDFVSLWTFRHNQTGELCFAIICRRFPQINKALFPSKKRKSM